MQNANELLGILHGFYGLGATLSPLICTTMITKGHLGWYEFYYVMIGISFADIVIAVTAFWTETGKKYREANSRIDNKKGGRTREALRNKVTWICSFFLLGYVGIEVALGGWVVVFMEKIRHAAPFAAGMSATAYWLGITVGRVVLGFITPLIGEKSAILVSGNRRYTFSQQEKAHKKVIKPKRLPNHPIPPSQIYTSLALISHLILWLVPSTPVSIASISLVGFFLGPFFPAAVIAATKLLPKDLHVASIGFAAAFGSAGACGLPFAVGAIAQARGVQVLMPIVLAALVVDGGIWACLPGGLEIGVGDWRKRYRVRKKGGRK